MAERFLTRCAREDERELLKNRGALPRENQDEAEDEIADLPAADKVDETLRHAEILMYWDGKHYKGSVEDIEWDKVVQERLYRIK